VDKDSISYKITPYSLPSLKQIIVDNTSITVELLENRSHIDYLDGYCDYLKAKTILVEYNYIDRDYLEDYSGYYVRCFHGYERKCVRIHLFNINVTEEIFLELLSGNTKNLTEKQLDKGYLGFIVLKNLPQTIFGRTCLKTYPAEGYRHYPIIKTCKANIFGIELTVQSLPFQEQDNVVAACATSALWSVLHGTSTEFNNEVPSPYEITKAATTNLPIESRSIPSDGLTYPMMAEAIRKVSLEPIIINVEKHDLLKAVIYAYSHASIPMILGVSLYDVMTDKKLGKKNVIPFFSEHRGEHAIAVTGYGIDENSSCNVNLGIKLRSSRINKIYVHDDQVGPYAKMEFKGEKIKDHTNISGIILDTLTTSWLREGKRGFTKAVSDHVLIPIYHKIRIPYKTILIALIYFDKFINELRLLGALSSINDDFEWDIYLTSINKYKKLLREDNVLKEDEIVKIVLEPMPRYIWVAAAYIKNKKKMEFLFDATDIEQGAIILKAIDFTKDKKLKKELNELIIKYPLESCYKNRSTWRILNEGFKVGE